MSNLAITAHVLGTAVAGVSAASSQLALQAITLVDVQALGLVTGE
eukprot:SAG31_NODE_30036_length_386_cov_0.780488_1_plen_44_part_10